MTSRLATFAEEIERFLGIERDQDDEREDKRASSARQRTADFQSKNRVHLAAVGHAGPRIVQRRRVSSSSAVGAHTHPAQSAMAGKRSTGQSYASGASAPNFKAKSGSPQPFSPHGQSAIHVFNLVLGVQDDDDGLMRARGGSRRSNEVFATSSRSAARVQVAARAAFAAGAQEAVFKIISSTPSKARAGALLEYLGARKDDDGKKHDIAVYTDEGHVLNGVQERKAFLGGFAESFEAPLQNTNFIEVQFALQSPADDNDLNHALNQAFDKKPFVYSRSGNTVRAYALTDKKAVAIAKVLSAGREKSRSNIVEKMEQGFVDAFARAEVTASATIIAAVGDERKAAYFLQKFIRSNRGVKTVTGGKVEDARNPQRAANKLFDTWKRDMVGTHQRRNAFHLLFSAKAGTDPEAVMRSARSVMEEKAHGHKYALAYHGDTQHVHVHVMVQAVSNLGERLNFKKADLYEWREAFAEKAREHGVAMVSTRRQEHAKPRPYSKEHAGSLKRAQHDDRYEVLRSTENRVLDKRSGMLDPQTARRDGPAVAAAWRQTAEIMRQVGVDPRFIANAEFVANNIARYRETQAALQERSVLQRMDLPRHLRTAVSANSPYAMRRRISAINGTLSKLEASLSAVEKAEFNQFRSGFNQVLADRLSDLQSRMDRVGLTEPEALSNYLLDPQTSSSVRSLIGKLEMAKTPSEVRTSIKRIHATLDDMETTLPDQDKVQFKQYRADIDILLNDRLKSLEAHMQHRPDDIEAIAVGNATRERNQEQTIKAKANENDGVTSAPMVRKDTVRAGKSKKHSESIRARRNSERDNDRGR